VVPFLLSNWDRSSSLGTWHIKVLRSAASSEDRDSDLRVRDQDGDKTDQHKRRDRRPNCRQLPRWSH
jgi:hypothetical protein